MSSVTRMLFVQLLKVFLTTLFVFASILIFADVVKEMQLHDIPAHLIAHLLLYMVPFAVKAGFQGALIFAACVVYGRFAASNELLAVKSMGISPLVMLWPAVALAVPLTFAAVWLHELDAEWGGEGVEKMLVDHADDIILHGLKTQGMVERPEFTIIARRVDNDRLYGVTIFCNSSELGRDVKITAQEAELTPSVHPIGLRIRLYRGAMKGPNYNLTFSDVVEETLLMDIDDRKTFDWRRVRDQRERVNQTRRLLLLCEASPTSDSGTAREELRERLNLEEKELARAETRFHYKWANASSSLFLIILAAPVAMLMRQTNYMTNFFVCFVPTVLIYQPLQRGPVHLTEAGIIPPYCVWFANVVIGIVGIVLVSVLTRRR